MSDQPEAAPAVDDVPVVDAKRLRVKAGWAAGPDGRSWVNLPDGVPAGYYRADDIEILGEQLKNGAKRARDMTAVYGWLLGGGVDKETASALLTSLSNERDRQDLRDALSGFGGLFGGRL